MLDISIQLTIAGYAIGLVQDEQPVEGDAVAMAFHDYCQNQNIIETDNLYVAFAQGWQNAITDIVLADLLKPQ